jgi:hypothetical protein
MNIDDEELMYLLGLQCKRAEISQLFTVDPNLRKENVLRQERKDGSRFL